jgi:hypothetical protein
MRAGDKWEVYIPSELAYGDAARGAHIKPGSVLVFELELLDVGEAENPWVQFAKKYAHARCWPRWISH